MKEQNNHLKKRPKLSTNPSPTLAIHFPLELAFIYSLQMLQRHLWTFSTPWLRVHELVEQTPSHTQGWGHPDQHGGAREGSSLATDVPPKKEQISYGFALSGYLSMRLSESFSSTKPTFLSTISPVLQLQGSKGYFTAHKFKRLVS